MEFTCCLLAFLVVSRPVLKCNRLSADVAVLMRSSGGRGDLGPDCELTVILGRGLGLLLLLPVLLLPDAQLSWVTL